MDSKTDREAATHRRPANGEPMFGKAQHYGSSERLCYPCLICSDATGLVLVTPSSLAPHAQAHREGYAEWLSEQEPDSTAAAIAAQEAHIGRQQPGYSLDSTTLDVIAERFLPSQ